jgi:hypothetical protein
MSDANKPIFADFGHSLNGRLAAVSEQLHADPAGDGDVRCRYQYSDAISSVALRFPDLVRWIRHLFRGL